jgi:hypothetical protein
VIESGKKGSYKNENLRFEELAKNAELAMSDVVKTYIEMMWLKTK